MTSLEDLRTLAKAGENEKALQRAETLAIENFNLRERIAYYLLKGDLFYTSLELEQALLNYYQCLELLAENTNPEKEWEVIYQEAILYDKIGQCRLNLRQIKDGLNAFTNALKLLESLNASQEKVQKTEIIQMLLQIAECYKIKNQPFHWRRHLKKAIDLANKLENYSNRQSLLAQLYASLAESYEEEDYEYAIMYWKKSAALYTALSETDANYRAYLAACYNNIAVNEKRSFEYEKAVQSYSKCLDLYTQLYADDPLEYKPFLAATHNSLGILFSEMFDKDEALNHYLEAHDIYAEIANEYPDLFNPYLATAKHNLGVFFDENQKYEQALNYYMKALSIRKNLADEDPELFKADQLITGINMLTIYQSLLEKTANTAYLTDGISLMNDIKVELDKMGSNKSVLEGIDSDLQYFEEYFNQVSIKELKWTKLINESIDKEAIIGSMEDENEKLEKLLLHLEGMDFLSSKFPIHQEFKLRSAESLIFGGWHLILLGQFNLAEKFLAKSLEINPNDIPAQVNYAHALYLKGDKEKALKLYKKILEQQSGQSKFYDQLKQELFQLSLYSLDVPNFNELTGMLV